MQIRAEKVSTSNCNDKIPAFSLVHIGFARLIVTIISTMLSGIVTALLVFTISEK